MICALFPVGPDVMVPLSTVCETFTSAQYRYTVCPYQYVNQIQVNGGNYRGCIGYGWCEKMSHSIWKEYSEPPISNSEIRLHMTDGENCFTGTDRETELIISCDDSLDKMLAVSAVNEVQTCRYVIEASSPLVCKIPVPEETVSVSVEMGDEVGVRRSELAEQGHVVEGDEANASTPDDAQIPYDASISNEAATPEDASTPSDHTANPTDKPATPDHSATSEPNPSANTLHNRIRH